jgi:hypothetical protein
VKTKTAIKSKPTKFKYLIPDSYLGKLIGNIEKKQKTKAQTVCPIFEVET